METEFVMLGSLQRFVRTAALCGAFLTLPTLADAGEWSDGGRASGGFGSGAVFVGRGGQVDRGVSFGFGKGRSVAVVGGGRSSSFEHYSGGRRYDAPGSRSSYRPDRYEPRGLFLDLSDRGRDVRDRRGERYEARRERFEDRRRTLSDGSFIRLRDAGRIDRFERDPRYDSRRGERSRDGWGNRALTAYDTDDWRVQGSTIVYGAPTSALTPQGRSPLDSTGPKILNVETERLDRRPIGPTGLDVFVTDGGSKIIRIAPGYRMAGATSSRRPAARVEDRLGLQPWSTEWLRFCQRTHASFDPDLGTYVTPGGGVRFCVAE